MSESILSPDDKVTVYVWHVHFGVSIRNCAKSFLVGRTTISRAVSEVENSGELLARARNLAERWIDDIHCPTPTDLLSHH